eukprot:RCo042900
MFEWLIIFVFAFDCGAPLEILHYAYVASSAPTNWSRWRDTSGGVVSSASLVDDVPFEEVGFCFQFYSASVSSVYISPNGFISLIPRPLCSGFCDSTFGSYKKRDPTSGGNFPLIGPFVENLQARGNVPGWIRYLSSDVEGVASLTVEWNQVSIVQASPPNNKVSFQAELLANGTMFFRYSGPLPLTSRPFVGLVWTTEQFLIVDSADLQPNSTLRLDPFKGAELFSSDASRATYQRSDERCSGYSDCLSCLAVTNCSWCSSIMKCFSSSLASAPSFKDNFCFGGDIYNTACSRNPSIGGYSVHVTYRDPKSFQDIRAFGNYSAASVADDIVFPDLNLAYDTIGYSNFTFPFFYNPPNPQLADMIKKFYINPNGFISMYPYYPCMGIPGVSEAGFCQKVQDYTYIIGPYLADLIPVRNTTNVTYWFTGYSLIVQWTDWSTFWNDAASKTLAQNQSLTFQTELYSNGTIAMRYFEAFHVPPSSSNYTCNASGGAGGVFFSPYNVSLPPIAAVVRQGWQDPNELAVVHWSLLQAGTEILFQPIPGCDLGCSGHGVCNSAMQHCTCTTGWTDSGCQSCASGWYGSQCSSQCQCQNGGLCTDGLTGDGRCSCNTSSFGGTFCEVNCTCAPSCPSCFNCNYPGGYCLCGRCQCNLGWTGLHCDQVVPLPPGNSSSSAATTPVGAVVISVIFVLMIVCGCVVIAVFCAVRRKRRQDNILVLERGVGGEREVVPVQRIPVQATPVQGIPLQQIPLEQLRMENLQAQVAAAGYGG